MSSLLITNARLITPDGIVEGGSLHIVDGIIRAISEGEPVINKEELRREKGELASPETPKSAGQNCQFSIVNSQLIDAQGQYVAPGCIDLHVHGAAGHDFMEATPEAFDAIRRCHALHGTTSMLATLAVSPPDVIDRCIDICDRNLSRGPGAELLGLHLEGNYINPLMKGAQDPTYIVPPQPEEYMRLLDSTHSIRRWSAAPELPGALDFARCARQHGVLVSLAHTTADYAQVLAAYDAGFTHATHFYNAMTAVHKQGILKHEGTVEAVLLTDGISVEVIADGIHVPPTLLQLVYKIKGPDRICLVTDALSLTGSRLTKAREQAEASPSYIVENGVCLMADRSALAGSVATTDRLLRTMVFDAHIPLTDAVRMASTTPARLIGVDDRKGSLTVGHDADLIFLDDTLHVTRTLIHGEELR